MSQAVCERVLAGLDEDLVPYVAGLLDDAEDMMDVVEQVSEFLISGGVCDDEAEAAKKTQELLEALGKWRVAGPPAPPPPPVQKMPIVHRGATTTHAAIAAARAVFGDVPAPAAPVAVVVKVEEKVDEKKKKDKGFKSERGKEGRLERVKIERALLELDLEEARVKAVRARWSQGAFKGAIEARAFTLQNPGGGVPLIEDAQMTLVRGKRYALVGRNGKGKSTLLQALAARRCGDVPANCSVHYVTQDVTLKPEDEARTPGELVVDADVERRVLTEERDFCQNDDKLAHRLNAAIERLDQIDADSADRRADELLQALGFSDTLRKKKMNQLSGGWRVRTNLAAALFARPDVLLLDEPTNHLSIAAVLWLARELGEANWAERIVVIVSHDRCFLEDVCTDVLHISGAARRLTQTHGSYETWEARRADQKLCWERSQERRGAEIAKLREFAGHGFKYGGSSSAINKMKMKEKQADKLATAGEDEDSDLAALEEDQELPMKLKAGGLIDGNIVSLVDVGFAYPGQCTLFEKCDLGITSRSRVVFVGENGNGKTTLVKLITGELEATAGRVIRSGHARIELVNQHHAEQIDLRLTPLQFMMLRFPADGSNEHMLKLRSHLANCGVSGQDPDLQNVPASALSGGQRSRVALAAVSYAEPHILVLDEPTNNLDLESVAALAQCVKSFDGAVICVSHDQFFVGQVATECWVVAKNAVKKAASFQDYVKKQHAKIK
ncbi:P-loop containing nucleoside triphosphate hydrolase protein [Pelagophyceae sp. CCMP2097]|nr:P-loop containing nucleoside triphosphate hydrolase protein [Pelagophyceae sp. CCMP2097]